LLRICTDKSCTSPVIQLVSRVLSIVAPYPAPPFDVGLEASQLMGSLPDTISMPLRESLSGLMADLAISEGTQAQLQSQAQTQAILPSGPKTTGTAQSFGAPETKGPRLCSLYPPDVYADTQPQALAILLASYRQQRQYDRNPSYSSTPPRPPKGLLDILKVAWTLTTDGDRLLSDLLSVAVDQISGEAFGVDGKGVDGWVLLVEDLPTLLRRWKDQPGSKTQFPVSLARVMLLIYIY
jgi:mediator of RNA polymerase II transcription subunit 5